MKTINKIRVNNFAGMIKMIDSGETLIKKCQRILDEGEPLTDGAPMIYTPKQAGVKPECNVRTDKWDKAMNAMDRVNNYKLTEYLKEGTTEAPNKPDGQKDAETDEAIITIGNHLLSSQVITNSNDSFICFCVFFSDFECFF